jgi:uncharacterized protein YdaU (DUF1376 family)
MAKDPAFLFYPGDWLGGTIGMTFEEKGAYMELLMMQFNRGHMTEHMIGQVIGQLWDSVKPKFIQDEKGLWFNERLDLEKKRRKDYTESRLNNLTGINQHTKKSPHKAGHMGGHTTGHMENESVNEIKDVIINKRESDILEYFSSKGYPREEGEEFFNHYQSQGWVTGSGMGIVNWKLKAENWHKEQIKREKKNGTVGRAQQGKGSIDTEKYKRLAEHEPIIE